MYDITGSKNSYYDYTARVSVLWPIMRQRIIQPAHVIDSTKELLSMWQARVKALRTEGWNKVSSQWSATCLCNCPPAGVHTTNNYSRELRVCRLFGFCPWCYMRNVGDIYSKFAKQLDISIGGGDSGIDILTVGNFTSLSKDNEKELATCFTDVWNVQKTLLKKLKSRGTYSNISVEPKSACDSVASWHVKYGILAMVDNTYEIPTWLDNGHRAVNLTHIASKKKLMKLLSKALVYPVGLMLGDIDMTLSALNVKQNKRCQEFSGCLRKKSKGP